MCVCATCARGADPSSARCPPTCSGRAEKEKRLRILPPAPQTVRKVQQTLRPVEQENIVGRKEAAGASRAASRSGKGGGAAGEECLLQGGGRNGEQMSRLPELPGVCVRVQETAPEPVRAAPSPSLKEFLGE